MSAVANLIPKIEGFQPIPNAVMIPFMEAQSAALAYGFGLNYEYGKRKIRSMSNEEFNKLTSEDVTNMSNNHTHIILSKFQEQVPHVMPMQETIFTQYVTIEKDKVKQNVELAKWMLRNFPSFFGSGNTDDILHEEPPDVPLNEEVTRGGHTGILVSQLETGGVITYTFKDGHKSQLDTREPEPEIELSPKGDDLSQQIKVIRWGSTPIWPDINGTTETLKYWIAKLKELRNFIDAPVFSGQSESYRNNHVGSIGNISQSIHRITNHWY